jgi:hypothetical protein
MEGGVCDFDMRGERNVNANGKRRMRIKRKTGENRTGENRTGENRTGQTGLPGSG